MKIFSTVIAAAVLWYAAAPAAAQQQGLLEIRTTVEKEELVVAADGSEETRLVPAEKVVPGDEVVYTVSFANVGEEPAENVVIINPLPAELSYIDGSATAPEADVQFSVDGGASYGPAADLRVEDEAGTRPAMPDEFTHIRWVMSEALAPGERGTARVRARLN